MKKIGLLLLFSSVLLCIAACTPDTENSSSSGGPSQGQNGSNTPGQSSNITPTSISESATQEIYALIDNETPKEQLLKKTYPLANLQDCFARTAFPLAGYALSIRDIHAVFPIECLRKISDRVYYIIYKVEEGGYLYVQLYNPYEGAWDGTNNALEQRNSYYMSTYLTDMAQAKVGDSFAKISSYDPNLKENNFNFLRKYKDSQGHYYTVHLTSQALYLMEYENCQTIEEVRGSKVIKTETYPNHLIELYKDEEYNFKVLNRDLQ